MPLRWWDGDRLRDWKQMVARGDFHGPFFLFPGEEQAYQEIVDAQTHSYEVRYYDYFAEQLARPLMACKVLA